MSIGSLFLKAAVRNGSRTLLFQIDLDWTLPDERPAFEFARAHCRQYGQIPSLQTFAENGHVLDGNDREGPDYYATRIRDRAVFNLIREHYEPFNNALQAQRMVDVREHLDAMMVSIRGVQNHDSQSTLALEAAAIREDYEAGPADDGLLGVTLGYPTLDELTNGAQPEDVIVVVGRPNKGKSFTLLHMAREAWLAGASILIVTMEMSSKQLATRFIGMETGINPNFIRKRQVSSYVRDYLFETLDGVGNRPPVHFMRGNKRKSVADVDVLIQELQPDIVYIDAGYLLKPEGKVKSNRREVIADVVEDIKAVATDRHKPIVITVQFNREVKKDMKEELGLHQIGETDVIAQIASVVVGLQDGEGLHETTRRRATVMKNREGSLGAFETHFRFYPMNFSEVTEMDATQQMLTAFGD